MNRIARRTLIAAALGAALAPAALAHHGWGSYDSNTVLTLNGTIRAATYENPHGTLQFDADGKSAWWELFRLHSVQGLAYADACKVTGITLANASHVNRVVATRLRDALRTLLERDGIRPDEIDCELGLMQDLLE